MHSETINRLVELVSSGRRMSGKLLSKLTIEDKTVLSNKFNSDDTSGNIYALAHNIEIPVCVQCGNKVDLISSAKGFRKFCSTKCSTKHNNKDTNAKRQQIKLIKNAILFDDNVSLAVKHYVDNMITIRDSAKLYSVPPHRLRKELLAQNLVKLDLKHTIKYTNWENMHPELFNGNIGELAVAGHTCVSIAKSLGVSANTIAVYGKKQNVQWKTKSQYETIIEQFLISNDIQYIKNDRTEIAPQELDFYIPGHNMGIEVNGEHWHSDKYKDKSYHLNKQIRCENKNIRLIQVYANEIENRLDNVLDILRTQLGMNADKIYARNTVLKESSKEEATAFLAENHLFESSPFSFAMGLYYKDKLVSVSTFRKPRFNNNYDLELIRCCTVKGTNVVGGLSKIIKHISTKYSIISYVHRRLFTGKSYENAGFKLSHETPPGYFWYSKTAGCLSRYQTQKHKLKTTLTESQYMKSIGFCKVHDCGQRVFVKEAINAY